MKNSPHKPLLLFDGICNLCNNSVNFIIKHDTHQQFKFASLQSDAAKQILLQFDKSNFDLDSIILIYNDSIYYKSSAILKLFSLLGGFFYLTRIFYIFPKKIRDIVYDYIAKRRYQWYGKRAHCMIPTKELKSRFIE